MLVELRIENLLLIERAELSLDRRLQRRSPARPAPARPCSPTRSTCCSAASPSAGIVRPGAGEAYVEGVFDLPTGLLDAPEFAELRDRLPDPDATEIALGRRVTPRAAPAPTSRVARPRPRTCSCSAARCSRSTASTSTASSRSRAPSWRCSTASPRRSATSTAQRLPRLAALHAEVSPRSPADSPSSSSSTAAASANST